MKNMKKIASLVLALVMVLSLAMTASADETPTTGTITIENTTIDKDYAIYKVFDATYSGEAISYSYTKTGETDALYTALTATDSPFILTNTDGGNTYYVTTTFDAAIISTWLKTNENLLTQTEKKTADSGTVEFTDLDFGYYYITSSLGTAVTINTVAPNATVIDKNDTVDQPDKVADDVSVELGQVVNFTVTEAIDRYVGTDKVYSYTFTDEMSEGLTFQKDVTIKVGDVTVTPTVDYDTTNNGFSVTVPTYDTTNNEFLYEEGTVITLTYTAVVNSDAVADVENNELDVKWTNQNAVIKDAGSDEVKVYSAKIVINKVDGEDDSVKLEGAKFVLYKEVTAEGKEEATNKYYKLENNKVTWVDAIADATTVTTDKNGAGSFDGLEDGTYYLQETEAPDGYNLLNTPVEIIIAGNDTDEATLIHTETVKNNSGTTLPSTGGMGTTLFYVFGGILVLAAVVLLVTKKRMNYAE